MKHILCYGDSNTFGTCPYGGRWDEDVRWPMVLQKLLGSGFLVTEEGLSGRNTVFDDPMVEGRNGLRFLPVALRSHRPLDLVILSLGGNDTKSFFNASARTIANGIATLVTFIRRFDYGAGFPTPKVLVVSPIHEDPDIEHSKFIAFDSSSYQKSLELWQYCEEVCKKQDVACFDASSVASPSPVDKLHMEKEGHLALAHALHPIVLDMLR